MSERARCALCGAPVPGGGEEPAPGEPRFCCEGCSRVYEIASTSGLLEEIFAPQPARASDLGRWIAKPGETAKFRLEGMWCAGCAVAAEQLLRHEPGVRDAAVSFAGERGRIQYDPEKVDPDRLMRKLNQLGYRAHPIEDLSRSEPERRDQAILLQLIISFAFSMQIMLLYIVQLYPLYATGQFDSPEVRHLEYLLWLLATPVLFIGGISFLRGAWRAARARTVTMDTLVALGAGSAYAYSAYAAVTGHGEVYFDSMAMITTFVMIGRYLETMGGDEARKGVRRLLHLQPRTARRRSPTGAWEEVATSGLAVDDVIMVRAGERVPVDGQVLEGEGETDESILTGESRPVSKGPGAEIYAGSLLAEGALICRAESLPSASQLARIAQMVEETLSTKPRIQRLADRASVVFTVVILSAAALAAAVRLLAGHPPQEALLAAIAVLVVACPCALGLATPLALTVVVGQLAEHGVLVRNPAALETAIAVRRVVFDKTGTLTRGELGIAAVRTTAGSNLDGAGLLCLASAVEQFSEHPLARPIRAACDAPGAATEFAAVRGLGARARVDGALVTIGSSRFVRAEQDEGLVREAAGREAQGETVIWVAQDGAVLGFIALRDEPNPTAREAIDALEAEGICVVMLSGDDPKTAAAVARELGIAEHTGHYAPKDKAEKIAAWQAAGERVAMVGDGVNDGPALAQADLSVTAAGGTEIAGETSDAILMWPDLALFPWFLQLAKRTRRIIIENLAWAFAYNLVAVPLAVLGLVTPLVAAAAMSFSSLLVVLNSLRLKLGNRTVMESQPGYRTPPSRPPTLSAHPG